MRLFFRYLRYHWKTFAALLSFAGVLTVSFALYRLPIQAVAYPAALCVLLGGVYLVIAFVRTKHRHDALTFLQDFSLELLDTLPPPQSLLDEEYCRLLRLLEQQQRCSTQELDRRFHDMVDYYTTWAHQIKTPIASMRLNLQNEDSAFSRSLQGDLSRIERYVDMVMTYLRLDSGSTDYVLCRHRLDDILCRAIRSVSGEFIAKKLQLNYEKTDADVLTDEKWLCFVVEQVLSNALKYTADGSVSIYVESPKTLCIRDTGMGIAPENLPRIFEKGFTGFNGRSNLRSSGIGLYLCKRVCTNLGHRISARSTVGEGTVISIDLGQQAGKFE